MTKLDRVIERLRQLPQAEQDVIIADIEAALDEGIDLESRLTDEQWEEVKAEMSDPDPQLIPHDQVVAEFEKKYGR